MRRPRVDSYTTRPRTSPNEFFIGAGRDYQWRTFRDCHATAAPASIRFVKFAFQRNVEFDSSAFSGHRNFVAGWHCICLEIVFLLAIRSDELAVERPMQGNDAKLVSPILFIEHSLCENQSSGIFADFASAACRAAGADALKSSA